MRQKGVCEQMAQCEKWRELISAYIDGECGPDERREVEDHLKQCPECRGWYEEVTADQELFTRALTGRRADITETVMRRLPPMSAATSEPRPRKLTGRLIELFVVLGILGMLGAILFPVFARSREKARQPACLSNVKQIVLAVMMYAQDNDGRLARASTWDVEIEPYLKNRAIYRCPADNTDQEVSYSMVPRYSGARLEDIANPETVIIIYESEYGRPAYRHNDGMNVGYADGHAKWLKELPPGTLDGADTTGVMPGTQGRNFGLPRELKIAYDAACEVWVSHIQEAVISTEKVFADEGGFVLSSELTRDGYQKSGGSAQIVGKVPVDRVADTVNALAQLGYVARRQIVGEDITDAYVSTERGVSNATAAVSRSEQERAAAPRRDRKQRDHEVATARAHLGSAQDQAFSVKRELYLATVTVSLVQRVLDEQPEARGVAAAWASFVSSARRLGVLLVWALLYGLLASPAFVGGYFIWRRVRR